MSPRAKGGPPRGNDSRAAQPPPAPGPLPSRHRPAAQLTGTHPPAEWLRAPPASALFSGRLADVRAGAPRVTHLLLSLPQPHRGPRCSRAARQPCGHGRAPGAVRGLAARLLPAALRPPGAPRACPPPPRLPARSVPPLGAPLRAPLALLTTPTGCSPAVQRETTGATPQDQSVQPAPCRTAVWFWHLAASALAPAGRRRGLTASDPRWGRCERDTAGRRRPSRQLVVQ